MGLLRGKIRAFTLLQIAWQVVSMFFGILIGVSIGLRISSQVIWLNRRQQDFRFWEYQVILFHFLLLILNIIGFVITVLYWKNIAPTAFCCLLDFLFVFSGQIFGLPVGMQLDYVIQQFPFFWQRIFYTEINVVLLSLPILILIFTIRYLYGQLARLKAVARRYRGIDEEGLGQGPQSFKYRELSTATKGFSSNELLGSGGFGSVYKGTLVLKGDTEPTTIAVKKIAATSKQGAQEFLAEVKIIGQVQHRNLVRVLGWCCEKDELLLVYNYMPNGSVDQHLHKTTTTGEAVLTWARRLRIMNDVATALVYLHEEWEQRVIHRNVKSSNVMLDCAFNARLGDFGLARLSEHNQAPPSTLVLAGTFGYLAPELFETLKPTETTDVYSFGAMVLEVATGKKPLLSAKDRESLNVTFLVDWVWGFYENNALLDAVDCSLQNDYDPGEMTMFLKIGLLCCHPNPEERPRMREVIHIWKGSSPFPTLPVSKPVPVFARSIYHLGSDTDVEDGSQTVVTFLTANSGQVDESRTTSSAMDSCDHSALTILSEADDDSPPPSEHH